MKLQYRGISYNADNNHKADNTQFEATYRGVKWTARHSGRADGDRSAKGSMTYRGVHY